MGLAVVMVLAADSCVVLGRRITAGRLRRNRFAGVRTAAALASDAPWMATQQASLPFLRVWALLFALGAAMPLLVAVVSAGVSAAVTFGAVVDLVVVAVVLALAVPMVLASHRAARLAGAAGPATTDGA